MRIEITSSGQEALWILLGWIVLKSTASFQPIKQKPQNRFETRAEA
jgi:hypothetical protein